MSSVKEAVRCAGGAKAVALACGVSVRAVYKWIAANALPRTEYTGETGYLAKLAALAGEQGASFDVARLKAAAAPRKANAAEPDALHSLDRRSGERRSTDRRTAERRQAERRA